MTNGRIKARARRARREAAMGLVLSWLDRASPQEPRMPWDYDRDDHLRSVVRLQACSKALRQQSAYVQETWRLLLNTYGKVVRYMGEFDCEPRWIDNELARVKSLGCLGPKAACTSLRESMAKFQGPDGLLYAMGGGQGGVECFGCVLHNNRPGGTPDPRFGTWIEKEVMRVQVMRWIIWWCPGLRGVLPHAWGLGAEDIMELWFQTIPKEAKWFLRPDWTISSYWECMPMARIKMQGGGYAFLLRGPARSS